MSQDYEMLSVTQDNPQLITYIREVHLGPAIEPHHKSLDLLPASISAAAAISPVAAAHLTNDPPEDTAYVLKLLNNKVSWQHFSNMSLLS